MSVTSTGAGFAAIAAAMALLTRQRVMVGIPDGGAREGGVSNAQLGYLHETGAPAQNIPARPWLVPAVESVQDKIADRLQRAADAAISGNSDGVMRQLNAAGMIAQNAAKAQLTQGDFEPLAESTIAARKAKGQRNVKPLLDTTQMRNSVVYVLRDTEA